MRWSVLMFVTLVSLISRAAEPGRKLDAVLATSEGKPTTLSAYYGKPTLLFYEDPDSLAINQASKAELARLSAKLGLAQRLTVVGVCDLRPLNWQPALFFALLVVRGEEQKARIPVLVDLTGQLERAPWNLSAKKSSVVLLSSEGELRFESQGPMSAETFARLVVELTRALAPPAEAAR